MTWFARFLPAECLSLPLCYGGWQMVLALGQACLALGFSGNGASFAVKKQPFLFA